MGVADPGFDTFRGECVSQVRDQPRDELEAGRTRLGADVSGKPQQRELGIRSGAHDRSVTETVEGTADEEQNPDRCHG